MDTEVFERKTVILKNKLMFGFSFTGCRQEHHQVAEGEWSPRQCQQF